MLCACVACAFPNSRPRLRPHDRGANPRFALFLAALALHVAMLRIVHRGVAPVPVVLGERQLGGSQQSRRTSIDPDDRSFIRCRLLQRVISNHTLKHRVAAFLRGHAAPSLSPALSPALPRQMRKMQKSVQLFGQANDARPFVTENNFLAPPPLSVAKNKGKSGRKPSAPSARSPECSEQRRLTPYDLFYQAQSQYGCLHDFVGQEPHISVMPSAPDSFADSKPAHHGCPDPQPSRTTSRWTAPSSFRFNFNGRVTTGTPSN